MSKPVHPQDFSPTGAALRITALYAVFSVAWIAVSGWLLSSRTALGGWVWAVGERLAFVVMSATLLFLLVRGLLRRLQVSEQRVLRDTVEQADMEACVNHAARSLQTIGDNLPGGAIYRLRLDAEGEYRFTYASRGIERILGIGREQMLADAGAVFALTEPPYDGTVREANERSARDQTIVDMELPQRLPDGRRVWIAVRSMPRRTSDGGVEWDGIVMDITGRKRGELETQKARATLESALGSMSEALLICDADGQVTHLNEAFARGHRFARVADCPKRVDAYDEVLEMALADGTPAAASDWPMSRALNGEHAVEQEYQLRRKDSEERWIGSYNFAPIRGRDGAVIGAVVTGRDVTLQRMHQAELDRLAHHDPLTGLPNRRLFSDRLQQAVARADRSGRSLAVCYLDLDGFKPINDRYGHRTGDGLLIELAKGLRGIVRAEDSVARLGGDEFVFILADLQDRADCEGMLERIMQQINRPITLDGIAHQVSASIGVAFYPDDYADPDMLLRHADQAMYQAKESGKNRCQFHSGS